MAIGRALVKEPELVFADEPTSALDWAHGEQVVQMLQVAAHQRGATVLIVAHDHRIERFADRVFHLEDGRLDRELENETPAGHAVPGRRATETAMELKGVLAIPPVAAP